MKIKGIILLISLISFFNIQKANTQEQKINSLVNNCWEIISDSRKAKVFENKKCNAVKSRSKYRFNRDSTLFLSYSHPSLKYKTPKKSGKWIFNKVNNILILEYKDSIRYSKKMWKIVYLSQDSLKVKKIRFIRNYL
ncbi:hypothetical protein OD91_1922 [Lutibacter sp. Hel_I_33_5]|uniref:hypothetical protein n=1 Tax=Lutibacter sp. Hel_I_33_5 TaxID=1566289 RepID=UPI0011A819B4|nr:hypothetical protein [Lutibacter sp. Hel_I_33_5]TVZ56628.1 hypothetical protein OD91_1922 [Lutibacter sp. Hel_I_33_5]